ncbi:MAG: phosphoribosylglycinamide formyltransferase [Verrucomicrobia bacterium]|nr:phosphoribosylglycinamide formyltransferase [Verrucomicrobiota bacterium]
MRVALLGSGRGSNAEAVLRAQAEGRLGQAKVVGIYCDNPTAKMLELGPRFGVPAQFLDTGSFKTKFSPEREQAWAEALIAARVDLVVLAGFMRVIKAPLLEAFAGRMINLHPSLLPAFPGLDAIGQAWTAGVNESGCTVHWVNADIDGGAHLGQSRVGRESGDTLETFSQKIHAAEHALLPAVIAQLSQSLSR